MREAVIVTIDGTDWTLIVETNIATPIVEPRVIVAIQMPTNPFEIQLALERALQSNCEDSHVLTAWVNANVFLTILNPE